MRNFALFAILGAMAACGSDAAAPATAADAADVADATASADVEDAVGVDIANSDAGQQDTTGTLPFGQACAMDQRVGRFEILQDSVYGGSVAGNVADRVDALQVLVAKESQGKCQLWQRKAAECQPTCTAQQQCVRDVGCQPYPAPVELGDVSVMGLVKSVTMKAKGANKDYFFTDFDADPFVPSSDITLQSGGGQLAKITLHGKGMPTLQVNNVTAKLTKGTPLQLQWTPSQGPFGVHLSVNVDQHGLSPVTLTCEMDDVGAFTVPVALTDALLSYGISGATTATLERRTVDSAAVVPASGVNGCVELVVASRVALSILAQ